MTEPRYATPLALRRGVTDLLRGLADERPGERLSDLLRQFAYDRLLARVFTAEPDGWVLKGAAAMLARLPQARHSKDIDLYSQTGDLAHAERALREAATLDLGDYFRFELGPAERLHQGVDAVRVPITAYLGPTEFASFQADLVVDLSMTGPVENVGALIDLDIGLEQPRYWAYPVVDHIADKVCAMLEMHPRTNGAPSPTTRYRDLVDLATFARTSEIDGRALGRALRSEARRRELTLPDHLPDPAGSGWRAGYARAARDAPSLPDRDLDAALRTARAMLDPILRDELDGRWDPDNCAWRQSP